VDQETKNPKLYAPLAPFEGAKPPAPEWFTRVIANEPERSFTEVKRAKIETLTWGERGKPGILFLHGNGAHADWWSFIAPFFADDHRVAAISWSGMGGSAWRKQYSLDLFAEEAMKCAEVAGLFSAEKPPVIVGHSFGGFPSIVCGALDGKKLRAVVLVDTPLWSPEQRKERREKRGQLPPPRPVRVYPNLEAGIARFRFAPPQACENLFIADYIARKSLKKVEAKGGNPAGYSWKFDPYLWREFQMGDVTQMLANIQCPVCIMWGERSKLLTANLVEFIASLAPKGSPQLRIPEADHHVMIDQPLAFVAGLRGLFAGWP
jgi:pimeloyl-ACP methyl ester carboxylesterase